MIRQLPTLLVATLLMGGCHRNKPASKPVRTTPPVRSSNPKEVKPVVISVTPVPNSKPVLVPMVRREQPIPARLKPESVPKAPSKPVISSGVSVNRPEQPKAPQSQPLRLPVAKSGRVNGPESRERVEESPKPQVAAVADTRLPWERPFYEPAASREKKLKSEELPKGRAEKAKEISADDARNTTREAKSLAASPTDKSSAPDSGSVHQTPLSPAVTDSNTQGVAKVAETNIEPTNQPKETVSGSSPEVTAQSPKPASKKSSRPQTPIAPVPVPSESPKAEESANKTEERPVAVVAATVQKTTEPAPGGEAIAQSDSRPPGPAPSLSPGESESSAGTVATIKPSIEVQKDSNDAQQITAVVSKKPSDADRKEAVRKQAIDSFHSGQQLIRESRNAEAMQALKQAVKLAPESADAWLRIAFLLEREGKLEEARRAFKEAKRFWSF